MSAYRDSEEFEKFCYEYNNWQVAIMCHPERCKVCEKYKTCDQKDEVQEKFGKCEK